MLKLTRTYTDYNGMERTEDFYFNFSKAELTEKHLSTEGGLDVLLRKIVDSQDHEEIVKTFKDIILKSYGKKSEDGKRFMKSEEISREFEECPAYSDLFMELSTDSDAASKFVNGIMPPDWEKEVEKAKKEKNA